jgi:hypothetical protein
MINNIFKTAVLQALILLVLASAGSAADWYVDNAAGGANNGTSWADAWTHLENVVWGAAGVKAGDTLYISGGASSKSYSGTLRIGAGGSAGAPITIRPGQVPGHNGVVFFNGNSTGCITAYNLSHITIDGRVGSSRNFRFRNGVLGVWNALIDSTNMNRFTVRYCEFQNATIGLNSTYCSASEFDHNLFQDMRGEAAMKLDGSKGEGPEGPGWWDSNKVHDNTIYADAPADGSGIATDMIQGTSALSIYNNLLEYKIGPNYGWQHPDALQVAGRWDRIYNNTIRNAPNAAISMDYGGSTDGHFHIFNNVIECTIPSWVGYMKAWDLNILSTVSNCTDMIFANNTVAGINHIQTIAIHMHGAATRLTDWKILNNIFYQSGEMGGGSVVLIGPGNYNFGTDVVIDYNLINDGGQGGNKLDINGRLVTQSNPRTAAPKFVSYSYRGATNDYRLLSSDTGAKDQGTSALASVFTGDKDGNTRPVGPAWDIGAYEYGGSAPTAKPAPPRNLRLK